MGHTDPAAWLAPTACATLGGPGRRIGAPLGSAPERRPRSGVGAAERGHLACARSAARRTLTPKRTTPATKRKTHAWGTAQPGDAGPFPASQMDTFAEHLADIFAEQ
jgi:hypothetical protein